MKNDTDKHTIRRKSIRLTGYDYCQPGGYFITICTHQMEKIFGQIINGEMVLNPNGLLAKREWLFTASIRSYVDLNVDEFIIMPNHIRGIIWITDVGATGSVAHKNKTGPKPGSLGAIIGQYKSRTSRKINKLRNTLGKTIWHRSYYDRIIRSEKELLAIRKYIINNPLKWEDDKNIFPKNFI